MALQRRIVELSGLAIGNRSIFLADGRYPAFDTERDGRKVRFRVHRLVMERTLGRQLRSTEVVHHRDGDRLNPHPNNLVLYRSQAEHRRLAHGRATPR